MCDLIDCKDCKHLCKENASDKQVEQLWEEFEDVLFEEREDDSEMYTVSDWQGFDAGTSRTCIWHWFDEHHSKGLYWLMWGLWR